LRRYANDKPFEDLIVSERTPQSERIIANHPSIKPQSFLRQIVYASLPLGEGTILDPFMGSGSTIAAASTLGLKSIGIERHKEYFELARHAIPKLASVPTPEIEDRTGARQQGLFDNKYHTLASVAVQKALHYTGMR